MIDVLIFIVWTEKSLNFSDNFESLGIFFRQNWP